MNREKVIKLAKLNLSIAILNIIFFSPGILSVEIEGESIFETSFGVTVIIMSTLIFILGNYKILNEKRKVLIKESLSMPIDYIEALKENDDKKVFSKDIDILIDQIERMCKKKEIINNILLQKFNSTEISYNKFNNVISQVEEIFYVNIKSILNKISIFDENEYKHIIKEISKSNISKELINEKLDIYNQYISFVKDSIEDNEQILFKLDKLILQLSKFNSLEDGELEKTSAIQEIDDLIDKSKFYKS